MIRHQVLPKVVFFLACVFGGASGYASTPAELQKEIETTQEAALKSMQMGPVDIPLAGQATLKLPAGYGFIAKETAAPFLKAAGNHLGEGFLGMVLRDKLDGFVLVEYAKSGYIKDDDAKNWNADELLNGLKDGTKEGNKERVERGLPAIEVTGWLQAPQYEAPTHRLVWSAGVKELNANAQQETGVNYNTYVLGREGFLSLNLVTSQNVFESSKPAAHELLESVHFDSGKAYEDFNADTDTVAEFGLAALVGGLAAKKLGLLAVIGAFLLKAWKVLAIAAFGGFAAFKRLFSKQEPKQES